MKIYLVLLYDMCGEAYVGDVFSTFDKAVNYSYKQIKNSEWLHESFIDMEIKDKSYEQYVKEELTRDGGIEELVSITEMTVH